MVRPERTRYEQHEILGASRTISPTRGRNREQGKPKEHLNLSQAIWNEFKMDRKAKPDRQRICHIEKGNHIPMVGVEEGNTKSCLDRKSAGEKEERKVKN